MDRPSLRPRLTATGRRKGDPPPAYLLALEPGRTGIELGAYLAARPLLQLAPKGDGHRVLVLPGLLAGDESTWALRRYLRSLGYFVGGWKLGTNVGPTGKIMDGMRDRFHRMVQDGGSPITVIGWSLGGLYARALTREHPECVRQVITLASPFRLVRPSQSRATRAFERYSHLHVVPEELPEWQRPDEPLAVPSTAVYSRTDGIVAWHTCMDTAGPRRENIEVRGSHCGLGHNPAVMYAVADRLAQPEGTWRRFKPPAALKPLYPIPHAWQPMDGD